MTRFKYNGTIIETPNLEKKLKRMRLSIEDIELLEESLQTSSIEDEDISENTYYYFIRARTGETIKSIYSDLNNLNNLINPEEWSSISKDCYDMKYKSSDS